MNKILVIDDSKVHLLMAGKFSHELNPEIEVVSATSGPEGLSLFEKNKSEIRLALIDYNMAPMNGYEVLEVLVKDLKPSQVVICSANVQQILAEKIKALGSQFIAKPLTKEKLRALLEEHNLI